MNGQCQRQCTKEKEQDAYKSIHAQTLTAMPSTAQIVDTQYLTRNAMFGAYQFASLLAPPIYTAYFIARRGRGSFSVNQLLRATWLTGLGGAHDNFALPLCSPSPFKTR